MSYQVTCFLGLGANLPFGKFRPLETIRAAVTALSDKGVTLLETSAFYRTSPVPASDQPDFVNCVISAKTGLQPLELLALCQSVETQFGRERHARWSARTLDIDILSYDDRLLPDAKVWRSLAADPSEHMPAPELVLPHPRLHTREFVLLPLCDLAPHWHHPVLDVAARTLLDNLPDADRGGAHKISSE